MSEQYQWNDTKQGLILSSFFYGYAITQVFKFDEFKICRFPAEFLQEDMVQK